MTSVQPTVKRPAVELMTAERELLLMLARGERPTRIALALSVSPFEVQLLRASLLRRLTKLPIEDVAALLGEAGPAGPPGVAEREELRSAALHATAA